MDRDIKAEITLIVCAFAGLILGLLLIAKGQGIHSVDGPPWLDNVFTLILSTLFTPMFVAPAIRIFLGPPTDEVTTMVGGTCLGLILSSFLIATGLVSGRGVFFTVVFCAFSLGAIGSGISFMYNNPNVRHYLPLTWIYILPGLLLGSVVYGLSLLVDWNAPIEVGKTDPTILKTDGMRVTSAAKGGTGDLLTIVAVLAIAAIPLVLYGIVQYTLVRLASIPINNYIERHFERKSKDESDADELKLLKTKMRGIGHTICLLTCVSILYLMLMLIHQ